MARFSQALLFLVLFSLPLFAQISQEDALTSFIVSLVLGDVRTHFPDDCPKSVVTVRTDDFRLLRHDTLFIPGGLWGFRTTNDYRLHYYAALQIYRSILSRSGGNTPGEFFLNAGRASDLALRYLSSMEKKDSLLPGLTVYEYICKPYMTANPAVIISRDCQKDSLEFFCVEKAVLGYRCDSTRIVDWVDTDKKCDYGIVSVSQSPEGFKKFRDKITLRNNGQMDVSFRLLLDFAGGDTVLDMKGFSGDTVLDFSFRKTLLKVVIDPYKTLFDANETNQQFVSVEFKTKRRAYLMFTLLIWDLTAAAITFGLMMLLGIFFHSLTNLFFGNNSTWTFIFVLLLIVIKMGFPFLFFGFNLWGLVYNVFYITSTVNSLWLAGSTAGTAMLVYYAWQKDGVNMRKMGAYVKFLLTFCVVEPLAGGIVFFLN